MKRLILIITLMSAWTAAGLADSPTLGTPGGESQNILPPGRDACWSEPADLEGYMGTSEIIAQFGLESEIANDFTVTGSMITKAIWWGGEYGVPTPCELAWPTPGFNLRFYEDAGCVPGAIVADLSITDWTEERVGCLAGHDPQLKYTADISVQVTSGALYWFGAQFKDHPFPGQGGRQAAGVVTGCESMLKSAYFGYPDWTTTRVVYSYAWDASQEFECGVTPVAPASWGEVKGLFR